MSSLEVVYLAYQINTTELALTSFCLVGGRIWEMVGKLNAIAPRVTKTGLLSNCKNSGNDFIRFIDSRFRGTPGYLEQVEIDTKNFLGNFPESCEIHAIYASGDFDWLATTPDDSLWTLVLPRTKLGPDRQHYFEPENVENQIYTHVKVTIYPDGGLKRVRILGRKAEHSAVMENSQCLSCTPDVPRLVTIPIVPLTADAYRPFGQVIQAYEGDSKPNDVKVTPANGGTAQKFHKLSLLKSSYPCEAGATTGISVYRCQPLEDFKDGTTVLKVLERHLYTSQVFIPMGNGSDSGSDTPGGAFLVVVAQNGPNDRPDMSTLKAFLANATQGISYNPGIWRKTLSSLPG